MVRVVALSGGYSRDDANERLSRNHGMIASFSRALTEGLTAQMSDDDFDNAARRDDRPDLRCLDRPERVRNPG